MVPADAEDAISSSPIVVAITNLNADIRNIFLTPLKQLRRRSVKVKSFFIRSRNWCEIQDKLSEAPQTPEKPPAGPKVKPRRPPLPLQTPATTPPPPPGAPSRAESKTTRPA